MLVSSEPTTVENNSVIHLNSGAVYMVFYSVVIMQIEKYPVLLIKSNQNIIVEIGIYLLKAFR